MYVGAINFINNFHAGDRKVGRVTSDLGRVWSESRVLRMEIIPITLGDYPHNHMSIYHNPGPARTTVCPSSRKITYYTRNLELSNSCTDERNAIFKALVMAICRHAKLGSLHQTDDHSVL